MAVLMLSVLLVRYRRTTGTLLHVLRRDSALQIISIITSRLLAASVYASQPSLGFFNIPGVIEGSARYTVLPILACRLLLNMRKTEDPGVQKSVSSLLFGAPRPGDNSEDEDDDDPTGIPVRPVQRYAGLGRQGDAKGGMARHDAEANVGAIASAEENGELRAKTSHSAGN
ncbi:hypothetical protein DFP72DRAFT_1177452 [Ephemerocybe angulata]|uniref:Uncharacterized protein n=1 Tax=Ephemerocybe angulata TaxID=980116 RepID=A0A8H6HDQ8_9AGAR|nr:hypothetical protein DFP72DRAFT_1177452 [Tulosesus angulatus]